MEAKFSPRVKDVISYSREEALRLGHDYTGNVERAPKWWIDKNLEWAYRLVKQPTRIKRQLPLIKFYFLLKFNKF